MTDLVWYDFQDELDHLEFLDEIRLLVEEIAWALAISKNNPTKIMWDEVDVYGDEPVFTSLLMDKIEAE